MQADQIHPGDFLGHRVLDLEPGVGLDEGISSFGIVSGGDEKFKGAESFVVERARDAERGFEQPIAQSGIQRRTGRHFDDLLVTALERALALPKMNHRPAVSRNLDFDMPGLGHPLLGVHLPQAEIFFRLGRAARIRVIDFALGGHLPHAAPAAARDRLDEHGPAFAKGCEELAHFGQ